MLCRRVLALISWSVITLVGAFAFVTPAGVLNGAASAASAALPLQQVAGVNDLDAVACLTPAFCVAVGQNPSNGGVVVPVTSGTPGTVETVPNSVILSSVACPSVTTCVAVGYTTVMNENEGVVVTITAGIPGSSQPVSGTAQLQSVSCPTK